MVHGSDPQGVRWFMDQVHRVVRWFMNQIHRVVRWFMDQIHRVVGWFMDQIHRVVGWFMNQVHRVVTNSGSWIRSTDQVVQSPFMGSILCEKLFSMLLEPSAPLL